MSVWARSYARKSRALGDPDDPAVVAHQLEACDRWATGMGIALKPEERIAEVGSGEDIEGRPRFAALLGELEQSPPGEGLLIVTEIARLSRADIEEIGRIMRVLRTAGVKVLARGRLFDLTQPDDEQYFVFQAANARHEVRTYAVRVADQMEKLTRAGELTTGAAPYGYRWQKGHGKQRGRLVPVPEQFAIVQALFADALHLSVERLSRKYGLPRPTVSYILRNPVYTGWPHRHTAWRKRKGGGTSSRMLPESEWGIRAERPGDYPAAVSLEQFYAVQEALSIRFRERAKTGEADGWCRRLLLLEDWPGAKVQLGSIDHDCTPCYTFVHPETGARKRYPREPIHTAAAAAILAALSDPIALSAALSAEEERAAANSPAAHRDRLLQERERLRRLLVELKLRTAGSDPEDRLALVTAEEQVKAQIRSVQAALGQTVPHGGRTALSVTLGPLLPLLEGAAGRVWERLTPVEKAALAEALLERIVVRIECPGNRRPCHREIVSVEYAGWYRQWF